MSEQTKQKTWLERLIDKFFPNGEEEIKKENITYVKLPTEQKKRGRPRKNV